MQMSKHDWEYIKTVMVSFYCGVGVSECVSVCVCVCVCGDNQPNAMQECSRIQSNTHIYQDCSLDKRQTEASSSTGTGCYCVHEAACKEVPDPVKQHTHCKEIKCTLCM